MKMKCLMVLSGGLDSTVALYQLLQRDFDVPLAVAFNYGSKHNDREHQMAARTCEKIGVRFLRIDITFLNDVLKSDLLKSGADVPDGHYAEESMKRTVVPFRNGIMVSLATGIAESNDCHFVGLGNHFGDHAVYPDCRLEFVDTMSAAMALGTYKNIRLLTPFVKKNKADIVQIGNDLNVDFNDTFSCYRGGELHCGKCSTCVERIEAFIVAGVEDPTEYYHGKEFALQTIADHEAK